MGELEGTFLASPEDVAEAMGKTIYFGEVLGKHSDIYGELEESDIELITDDQKVIELLTGKIGNALFTGYDPIEQYIEYRDDGGYDE